jgi:hypothetical protein
MWAASDMMATLQGKVAKEAHKQLDWQRSHGRQFRGKHVSNKVSMRPSRHSPVGQPATNHFHDEEQGTQYERYQELCLHLLLQRDDSKGKFV